MKKHFFKFFLLAAFAAAIVTGCSKDEQKSVAELLMGKWTSEYIKTYVNNVCVDTTMAITGDYVDFRSDHKVYSRMQGSFDTTTYQLLNDTKLLLDGTDTVNIVTISENNLLVNQKMGTFKYEQKFKK